MKQTKRPKASSESDVLVPWLNLDSPRDHSHKYRVSRTLDTETVFNLVTTLMEMGHTRGRTLYNHPPEKDTPERERMLPLKRLLGPGHKVIAGSRPGLFEDPTAYPRWMKPGYTELEEYFNAAWRPWFEIIRRNMYVTTPSLRPHFRPGFENRAHAEVAPRQGSVYRWLAGGRKAMPKEPRTPVFLLNKKDFYKGVALTSIFGMDGVSGLTFSTLLSERYREWLTQPGLRIVELIGTPIPRRMEDLSFSDSWEAVSILHVEE